LDVDETLIVLVGLVGGFAVHYGFSRWLSWFGLALPILLLSLPIVALMYFGGAGSVEDRLGFVWYLLIFIDPKFYSIFAGVGVVAGGIVGGAMGLVRRKRGQQRVGSSANS
jgi:hypothetical protein